MKKLIYINPFFLILRYTIAKNTFHQLKLAKEKAESEKKDLLKEFEEIESGLIGNVLKQSFILMLMIASILLVHFFVKDSQKTLSGFLDNYKNIITGLITGWFVVTFASVKKMFIADATAVTFFMFASFSIVWSLIGLNIIYNQPHILKEIGLLVIVFAWIASAMYDNVDYLRAGLDEAALEYYQQAKKALKVEVIK